MPLTSCVLLAQNKPGGLFDPWFLMPIVAIVMLFYFMIVVPERRKKRQQEYLLGGINKNDRVVTIGGILGTVASVQKGSDEVTLKIDETSGAKLRIRRSAIATVVKAEEKGDKSEE